MCPAARQFLRTERPVPPVAPKMATVGFGGVEEEEDIVCFEIVWFAFR